MSLMTLGMVDILGVFLVRMVYRIGLHRANLPVRHDVGAHRA